MDIPPPPPPCTPPFPLERFSASALSVSQGSKSAGHVVLFLNHSVS